MTDYEHVPCPVCQGRGRIPLEEAAKIAGVSLEEARRAAREAEKQKADDLEQRIAEAAARRNGLAFGHRRTSDDVVTRRNAVRIVTYVTPDACMRA